MKIKYVAVIGAGASGLTAIKSCLEAGLEVVCYEQSDDVSGLWKYRPESSEGAAGCMRGTYMNCSKEMSAFSDFPPPEHFPNYMPHAFVYQYLVSYADRFDLRRHIHFTRRVMSVRPSEDHSETGRWKLDLLNLESQVTETVLHDAVMVCAGHHVYPYYPDIAGMEEFQGLVMHSHKYKTPEGLSGKRVAVVGLGNSGADIAVEASHVAEQVYLCSRKGGWIHPRMADGGKPFDAEFYRRLKIFRKSFKSLNTIFTEAEADLNSKFDHALYGLKPVHRVYNQYTIVNDELPIRILNGTVQLKRQISTLTRSGIRFSGDPEEYPLDVFIYATGYRHYYPFLSKDLVDLDNCPLELYRFVFPVRLSHPTLTFVGLIDPEGSVFTVSEMQSRWITQVWTGGAALPAPKRMSYTCEKTLKLLQKWGNESSRHQTRIFWLFYMERIASYIGAKPNFTTLFFTDPKLFWACLTGPCLPYQYRINGPFCWPESRAAILNYEDRMRRPLTGKPSTPKKTRNGPNWVFKMAAATTSLGLAVVCVGLVMKAKVVLVWNRQ